MGSLKTYTHVIPMPESHKIFCPSLYIGYIYFYFSPNLLYFYWNIFNSPSLYTPFPYDNDENMVIINY